MNKIKQWLICLGVTVVMYVGSIPVFKALQPVKNTVGAMVMTGEASTVEAMSVGSTLAGVQTGYEIACGAIGLYFLVRLGIAIYQKVNE
jgi:hypothetical protein